MGDALNGAMTVVGIDEESVLSLDTLDIITVVIVPLWEGGAVGEAAEDTDIGGCFDGESSFACLEAESGVEGLCEGGLTRASFARDKEVGVEAEAFTDSGGVPACGEPAQTQPGAEGTERTEEGFGDMGHIGRRERGGIVEQGEVGITAFDVDTARGVEFTVEGDEAVLGGRLPRFISIQTAIAEEPASVGELPYVGWREDTWGFGADDKGIDFLEVLL